MWNLLAGRNAHPRGAAAASARRAGRVTWFPSTPDTRRSNSTSLILWVSSNLTVTPNTQIGVPQVKSSVPKLAHCPSAFPPCV